MLFPIEELHPCLLAFCAGLFTWSLTALGSSIVFFFKTPKKNLMDAMLGFAAGVMVAASYWSLLSPALEMADQLLQPAAFVVSFGFLCGGILLFLGDKFYLRLERKNSQSSRKRAAMLMFSITLHNIPEGLAVGVGFGSLLYEIEGASLLSACLLALGIGLQNFPEGTAVSVPLYRDGLSKVKAFTYGQLSGFVEPLSSLLGALAVFHIQKILPFMLSFAAGAMIYVVVEELIPESQTNERKDFMALFTLIGFVVMMMLDVVLG